MSRRDTSLTFTTRPYESMADALERITAGTGVRAVVDDSELGRMFAGIRHDERVKKDPRLRHATTEQVDLFGPHAGLRRVLRNTGMEWKRIEPWLSMPF